MRKLIIFLSLSILIIGSDLYGQQLYAVQLGTFIDIRPQDFDEIRPIGFVYAHQLDGNLNQVFLGNYTQTSTAQQVVNILKSKGFNSAQVLPLNINEGQQLAVIQIATRYSNRPLNWEEFKKAGELNVIVEDERIKIFSVTFPDVSTAKNMLPNIQALGFSDAFVKTVNASRLIPVTSISTGIKKDLIPLNLSTTKTPVRQPTRTATVQPQAETATYNTTGARIITNNTPSVPRPENIKESTVTTKSPVATAPRIIPTPTNIAPEPVELIVLPNIRGNIKRSSALNLQTLLKQEGYYDSSLDGYYGPGTNSAFQSIWTQDNTVIKYKTLAVAKTTVPKDAATVPFFSWEEVQLLYTIAMDINPEAARQTAKLNAAAVRRYQLSLADKPLSASQFTLLNNWQNSSWKNIDQWAANDPFLTTTAKALRLSYLQSQVRLEDYYIDKGFGEQDAKTLAIASLQAIVGVAFERF